MQHYLNPGKGMRPVIEALDVPIGVNIALMILTGTFCECKWKNICNFEKCVSLFTLCDLFLGAASLVFPFQSSAYECNCMLWHCCFLHSCCTSNERNMSVFRISTWDNERWPWEVSNQRWRKGTAMEFLFITIWESLACFGIDCIFLLAIHFVSRLSENLNLTW